MPHAHSVIPARNNAAVRRHPHAAMTRRTALALTAFAPLRFRPAPSDVLELFVDKTGALSGKRHRFVFERYEGTVDRGKASVTFRIEAASIVCKDTWVSASDLKKIERTAKTDMLAIDRFPSIDFVSTGVEPAGPDILRVSGSLSIRGISKPVELHVELREGMYRGTATVRLTDYGLKPPSAALGLVGTKNEMKFAFALRAQE